MKLFLLLGMLFLSAFSNAQLNSETHPEIFRGVLFDLKTSQPIEGALLTISSPLGEMVTMTDEEGFFIVPGAPKSNFRVIISMTGYEDKVLEQVSRVNDVEYHIGLEPKKVKHLTTGY